MNNTTPIAYLPVNQFETMNIYDVDYSITDKVLAGYTFKEAMWFDLDDEQHFTIPCNNGCGGECEGECDERYYLGDFIRTNI